MNRPRMIIGRSQQNDIPVSDIMLSRRHCEVFERDRQLWVRDLASRNGIFIGGQRLPGEAELTPGVVVALGNTTLCVRLEDTSRVIFEESAEAPGATMRLPIPELLRRAGSGAEEPRRVDSSGQARAWRILSDINKALIRQMGMEEIYDFVLDKIFEHFSPQRGALLLRHGSGRLQLAKARVRGDAADVAVSAEELRISGTLIKEVIDGRNAVMTLDAPGDRRFEAAKSIIAEGIQSILAAPLWNDHEVTGMVYLDSTLAGRRFTESDLELLGAIANVAAVKIENAALLEEAMEKRRIEGELRIAAEIQRRMLPHALPAIPGYEIFAENFPSREVSGDYYDLVTRPDGALLLLIADVCGKGISAALLMASLQASFRASAVAEANPAALLRCLNDVVHGNAAAGKFVTVFLGLLDPANGELAFASAGHNPALVIGSAVPPRALTSTGMPLGLFPGRAYGLSRAVLAPGELLCLYTDGITEATSPLGEEWGEERLRTHWIEHAGAPLADGAEDLFAAVKRHVAGLPQQDDITLMLLRRRAAGVAV